jgi:dihydrofolate reductase
MDRKIVFVVARALDGTIGTAGAVPWQIKEDLRHFVRETTGRPMIMGRKTFESLPGLLTGRRHIVLTRDRGWSAPGAEVVHTVEDALKHAGEGDIAVIGGAEVYALFLPHATHIELTEIHEHTGGDTFMPAPDPQVWRETRREERPAADGHPAHAFVTLERRA